MPVTRVYALCQDCLEDFNVFVIRMANNVALSRLVRRHLIDQHGMQPDGICSLEVRGDDGVFYRHSRAA